MITKGRSMENTMYQQTMKKGTKKPVKIPYMLKKFFNKTGFHFEFVVGQQKG